MTSKWQPVLSTINCENRLDSFYRAAVDNNFPVAVWRCPYDDERHAVVDLCGDAGRVEPDFGTIPSGFLFAPFREHGDRQNILLKANLHLQESNAGMRENLALNHNAVVASNKTSFTESFIEICNRNGERKNGTNSPWFVADSAESAPATVSSEVYCEWVSAAVDAIRKEELKKVVLSRSFHIQLHDHFHPMALFYTLCRAYPNAFISIVAIPEIGTWIGATPELLLSIDDEELTTVSLAGTKAALGSQQDIWSNKEIVEQAICSDYIRDCFMEHDIVRFAEYPLETVRIGNIYHLQTRFSWKYPDQVDTDIINHVLKAMHPTPAVCGVSKDKALEFIQNHEQHDREYYAGYLGPVNIQNESNLFVNLRCLQLRTGCATLYAGGGITIDSIPENEWQETELKLNALLKFLERPDVPRRQGKTSEPLTNEDKIFYHGGF